MTSNQFWHQRWQDNNIGFHQVDANEMLQQHLADLSLSEGDTVLVPFCGASVDMLYLLKQGYRVKGTELSDIACQKFFQDNDLAYELEEIDDFKIYRGRSVTLYCGDHYALPAAWFSDVNAIYDRGALNAVSPGQRSAYIEKSYQLCVPFKLLLNALTHDESQKSGPPFSLPVCVPRELYQPQQLALLSESTQTHTVNNLTQRDFVDVAERCYLIR